MLATTGPPVRFEECKLKYGPWPKSIPKGSTGWQDGQHANMSSFLISFTNTGVKGIKTEWVSFLTKDKKTPSFVTFSHGTVTGKQKATVSPLRSLIPPPLSIPQLEFGSNCTSQFLISWYIEGHSP